MKPTNYAVSPQKVRNKTIETACQRASRIFLKKISLTIVSNSALKRGKLLNFSHFISDAHIHVRTSILYY